MSILLTVSESECEEPTEILDSSFKPISVGENILESCNNEFWRSPIGKKGKEAEMIIDLKCPMELETFSVMNGFGYFGTKKFSLLGSNELTGPWTELFSAELPDGFNMTEEV